MSLLPRILEGKALQAANEIHSIIWSLSYTLGMALSGMFVYWLGTSSAFLLDAGLFILVLILLRGLKIDINMENVRGGFTAMMADAYRYIRTQKIVLHLMLLHAVIGFTAFDALVALSAQHYYANVIAVSMAIGLIHASRALGLVIGPMVLGNRMNNRRLGYLLIIEALAIALWAIVLSDFYLSLAASVLVGFVTTTLWSYTYTLLQHHTEPEYYGRVIAYNDMIFLGVGTVTSLMIGYLAKLNCSLETITLVLAVLFLIASGYYGWIRNHFTLKEFE